MNRRIGWWVGGVMLCRPECRQDKRDVKQDARQDARDVRRN
jgi:hypothetical protein